MEIYNQYKLLYFSHVYAVDAWLSSGNSEVYHGSWIFPKGTTEWRTPFPLPNYHQYPWNNEDLDFFFSTKAWWYLRTESDCLICCKWGSLETKCFISLTVLAACLSWEKRETFLFIIGLCIGSTIYFSSSFQIKPT